MTEPRWGLGDVAVGLAGSVVLSALGVGVAAGLQGHDRDSLAVTLAALVGLWAALVGVPVVAARRKSSGSVADDFGLRVRPVDVPVGVAAGLATQLLVLPVLYAVLEWLSPDVFGDPDESAEELFEVASGTGRWVLAVAVVVGAPLVEELFYRGLFQRAAARRWSPRAAVAVTAVVFAVVHFQVVALPGLALFGVVLGVLAMRTGRLGSALVAHMAFNAATVVVVLGG